MTYIPEHFQVRDERALREFMGTYDFATIVSVSPEGPVISHAPVLLRSEGGKAVIAGHLARANPHWRLLDGAQPATIIFHGPHGYVSPTWYAAAPAVPTWNYGVVHARGRPAVREDGGFLRGVLDELARRYEGGRPDGWSARGLPAEYYERMRAAVVGFEMPVLDIEGKFKLGQNRSVEDRRRVAAALEKDGSPRAGELAAFMRRWAGA
jgi:transcriptional regulator